MNVPAPQPAPAPQGSSPGSQAPAASTGSGHLGTATVTSSSPPPQTDIKTLSTLARPLDAVHPDAKEHTIRSDDRIQSFGLEIDPNKVSSKLKVGADLIVDLDFEGEEEALAFLKTVSAEISWVKISRSLFTTCGIEFLKTVSSMGFRIFLDVGFDPTSATSRGTLESLAGISVDIISMHLKGDKATLHSFFGIQKMALPMADIVFYRGTGHARRFLANDTAIQEGIETFVTRLATYLEGYSLVGIVCHALELAPLRKHLGPTYTLITQEGISLSPKPNCISPSEAVAHGASYIVLASTLNTDADPVAAIRAWKDLVKN